MAYKILLNDEYFMSTPECPFEFKQREMDNAMSIMPWPKSDTVVVVTPETPGEHVTVAFRLPEFGYSTEVFDKALDHNQEITVVGPDGNKVTFVNHYRDTLNIKADLVPEDELSWTVFIFETHIKPE